MTEAELLEEVVVRPRSAFVAYPGIECIEREGWHQLITPALKFGGLNGVYLAVLDESHVDSVIDATLARYQELGIHFRWNVGPDSRPLDLGDRLQARGLRPVRVIGMASTHLADLGDSNVCVEKVDATTLPEFNDLMSRGWGLRSQIFCDYNAHLLRTAPAFNPMFIARIDGQGVGAASYTAFPKSAYLIGAVVLPEFRGQGAYTALVRKRQEHAREAGIELATCHAMANTSAPILERLGFSRVCEFFSYKPA